MRTIQIKIPENLDLKDHELSMIVAAKMYEDAKLTAGQAASMAGLSKRAFIELLGKYEVSVFSKSVSELHSDIENA
jgi:predicted HTH domain antitoxin